MTGSVATVPEFSRRPGPMQVGRSFINPAFDYLLIGGGLSLLAVLALQFSGGLSAGSLAVISIPTFILLSNSAHFAASTVRLYTKPGAFRQLPFLTMGFPLVTVGVLTLAIVFADAVGRHLNALYLTWSPYHYAAQAYGLALMYSYRSGCQINPEAKRLLWATCMLPFLYAFVMGGNSGIGWFIPQNLFGEVPWLGSSRTVLARTLMVLSFGMPLILLFRLYVKDRLAFPAISMLLIVTNGIWWIVFTYMEAFVWATVFHGLQYIAIVTIFHVRDKTSLPDNRRGWLYHTLMFYGICVVLGYALFNVWPYAYVMAGFNLGESMLLVAAVVNIHHFIVDRYIWRLKKDPNYKIVVCEEEQAI